MIQVDKVQRNQTSPHRLINISRLFIEIIVIIALTETLIMFLLPVIAPDVSETAGAILDASLLSIIAGPVILWRFSGITQWATVTADLSRAKEQAELALRETAALRSTLDHHSIFSVADASGRIVDVNNEFCRISGYTREELIGQDHKLLNSNYHPKSFWVEIWKTISSGKAWRGEVCNKARDGSLYWVDSIIAPFNGPDGKIQKYVSIRSDITARKHAEAENRKLSTVVEQAFVSVVITDLTGHIEYVNPAFEKSTGYSNKEVLGKNINILKSGLMPAETYAGMWREIAVGREWRGELQNRRSNGELFWELAVISPLRDDKGNITHYLAVNENITLRKAMEEELRTAARTDKLTGLPNRALLGDRLQQAVLRAKRHKEYRFAVLFLDFDRFKTINDSLGHDIGDLLLQEIAQRLNTTVRTGDSMSVPTRDNTTARLGGDEFVVLLDSISSPDDATLVANRLLDVFSKPYRLGKHEVYSTASIGIVTSDLLPENADDILRDADTAMYEAKIAGKGRYVMFDVSMRQRVQNRMNLENDLRRAIETDQLFLMYQPIVSLLTGKIESFEALVRWKHPERGIISPAEFIPIAEDTGLVIPIGEWVLREACSQFVRWRKVMGEAASPSISVNLSRSQLLLPNLIHTIQEILEQTGMPASSLHLEVTESAVMKDVATATHTLHAIKAIGVKLDMDDFGTGYSSLACLHQFPIDVLKIDQSFIANIDRGRDFTALVHAVAQLARNLNISVVAEGIETPDQALVLQSLECEFGQGYLFSRPLYADKVPDFRVNPGVLPGQTGVETAA